MAEDRKKDTLEDKADKEAKKNMKLPVYHSNKGKDEEITIRFSLHPRKVERFFFILLIAILLAVIIFQPAALFDKCEAEPAPEEVIVTEEPETALETPEATVEVTETPEPEVIENETVETVEEPEEVTPAPVPEGPVVASKIAFQITDFTVIQKSETWYKVTGVEVKVTNSGSKLYPIIKVWYYDDATKHYFDPASDAKDQQVFSMGMEKGTSRTFNLNSIDESFSGEELNPTIVAKLYNQKNGALLKEVTKLISID